MHLLIVEDERALCDTVARSLRRSAYSVDCCYDCLLYTSDAADE